MSEISKESLRTDLNIVLLGKTGAGKSASGNTFLGGGRKPFKEGFSPSSVTKICRIEQTVVNEQEIHVIDSVGLPGTTEDNTTDVHPKLEQIFACAQRGVDVFLLVIRLGEKFTESKRVVKWIQDHFGPKASNHTLVLFTHGDQLKEKIEDYLQRSPRLQSVINQYSRRYHVFNNRNGNQSQVTELLEKISRLREENGYRRYTEQDYKTTQEKILKGKCVTGAAVVGGVVIGGAVGGPVAGAAAGAALLGFGVYFLARKFVGTLETGEDRTKKQN